MPSDKSLWQIETNSFHHLSYLLIYCLPFERRDIVAWHWNVCNGKNMGLRGRGPELNPWWVCGTDLLFDSEHTLSLLELQFPQPEKEGNGLDGFFSGSS